MKKIRELFSRPIDRKIEEVIKVDQADQETVYSELEEYVVTESILEHYRHIYDEIIQVSAEDALQTARLLAYKEGILSGISGGANVWAAIQLSNRKENESKTIVTFVCDTGERYVSTEMYDRLKGKLK